MIMANRDYMSHFINSHTYRLFESHWLSDYGIACHILSLTNCPPCLTILIEDHLKKIVELLSNVTLQNNNFAVLNVYKVSLIRINWVKLWLSETEIASLVINK